MGTTFTPAISFEQWMRRPVYVVQCYTATLARALLQIDLDPGQGLALRYEPADPTGLITFRALPAYRSAASMRLRSRVAALVRKSRAKPV